MNDQTQIDDRLDRMQEEAQESAARVGFYTLVEGAQDETFRVPLHSEAEAERLIIQLYSDVEGAELYRIDHPHVPGRDCECAQFATDHRPVWTN